MAICKLKIRHKKSNKIVVCGEQPFSLEEAQELARRFLKIDGVVMVGYSANRIWLRKRKRMSNKWTRNQIAKALVAHILMHKIKVK